MNILEKSSAVLGEVNPESVSQALNALYETVGEIKGKLGSHSGLLTDYLYAALTAAPSVNEVAVDGFNSPKELRRLCASVLNGEREAEGHPLYEKVKKCIETNPLPEKEGISRADVYVAALAGDFCTYAIGKYYEKLKSDLDCNIGIPHIVKLYGEVCAVVGDEEPMERLNDIIKDGFILVPLITAYAQGLINNMALTLTTRMPGTGGNIMDMALSFTK